MTTIEDKLNMFSKAVYDRIQEEKQKDFEKFEGERKAAIEALKRELEEKKSSALYEVKKKADLKANEAVSAEKVQSNQAVMELKKQLIMETVNEIRNRLISFSQEDEYGDFLIQETESTLSKLEDGEYTILLKGEDISKYGSRILEEAKKFNGLSISIKEATDDIIGGLLVMSTSGKFRINNSIAVRLDDFNGRIGLMVAERLVEEVQQK